MSILDVLAESPGHLLMMLLLLGASAFFSMSETALFNLSREQLRRFRASGNPLRRLAARLMDDPRRLLVTVLFGNMAVNTAFFVMGVTLIESIGEAHLAYADAWRVVVGAAIPLVAIVFGEITPKSVAAAVPERLAPLAGPPLAILEYAVLPIRVVLSYVLVIPVTRLALGVRREEHAYVTNEELQAIVEVAAREGVVTVQEGDMLTDILDLGDRRVREVMVPRVEIAGCDAVTPMAVVLAVFRRTRHTKMVVYEGEMDHIVGVVYAKTAFLNPDKPLSDLVRPVYYVPTSKRVEDLLKEFRARKVQFAVVVDEYGGVAGLVTLEDCLEEIVGEIASEADGLSVQPVQRLSASEYLLAGNLSIRSWADAFDLDVPAEGGRFSTLAGFVTSLLGRLPRPGDAARWRNIEFVVDEVCHHRVTRVRLHLLDEAEAAAAGRAAPPTAGGEAR